MVAEAVNKAVAWSGPGLDVCFCILMIAKGRWRNFPALFLLTVLDLLSSIVLYSTDPAGSSQTYALWYMAFDVASFLLQLGVLYEIAKNILRPAGVWNPAARKPLVLAGSIGATAAALATWLVEPSGIHGLPALELRAEVFTGLLTCELVIAMMLSAREVGLPWRSHVMAIGQGLMAYQLATVLLLGVAAAIGPLNSHYSSLYYVRSVAYIVVLGYWTVSLWRTEPARLPISPALQKYVLALHERVQYDLGKVSH